MFVAEENVDFRIHVENQTRARDDVSRKQLRVYQLYSRTSGKHIQVLGRRISAKGEDGDKYGKNIYYHLWYQIPMWEERGGEDSLSLMTNCKIWNKLGLANLYIIGPISNV